MSSQYVYCNTIATSPYNLNRNNCDNNIVKTDGSFSNVAILTNNLLRKQ